MASLPRGTLVTPDGVPIKVPQDATATKSWWGGAPDAEGTRQGVVTGGPPWIWIAVGLGVLGLVFVLAAGRG